VSTVARDLVCVRMPKAVIIQGGPKISHYGEPFNRIKNRQRG